MKELTAVWSLCETFRRTAAVDPTAVALRRLSSRSPAQPVTYCRVDAAGVPAMWVEASVATEDQFTIVYFLGGGDAVEQSSLSAGNLAIATGARVLTVACSPPGKPSFAAAVEAGVAAYAWLLGEGCNLDLTAFTHHPSDASLVEAILVAGSNDGLPVPPYGTWLKKAERGAAHCVLVQLGRADRLGDGVARSRCLAHLGFG